MAILSTSAALIMAGSLAASMIFNYYMKHLSMKEQIKLAEKMRKQQEKTSSLSLEKVMEFQKGQQREARSQQMEDAMLSMLASRGGAGAAMQQMAASLMGGGGMPSSPIHSRDLTSLMGD